MSFDVNKFVNCGKKIIGAGLNYKSMISSRGLKLPEAPVLFLKPTSSYITEGEKIRCPAGWEVHHEVELGVIVGKECKNVSPSQASQYIAGYCLALDLTAVDQLGIARKVGLPWSLGKGFDTSCPVGKAMPAEALPEASKARLWLEVNGQMKQDCTTADMVFTAEQLLSYASQFMKLEPYDLILTGTPDGTGPIKSGDVVRAGLSDKCTIEFHVA